MPVKLQIRSFPGAEQLFWQPTHSVTGFEATVIQLPVMGHSRFEPVTDYCMTVTPGPVTDWVSRAGEKRDSPRNYRETARGTNASKLLQRGRGRCAVLPLQACRDR